MLMTMLVIKLTIAFLIFARELPPGFTDISGFVIFIIFVTFSIQLSKKARR